jgi:hypothetical protein
MALYPGNSRDVEAFIVIASKEPMNLALLLGKDQNIPFTELYRILLNIPGTEWVEEIIPYEIRRK